MTNSIPIKQWAADDRPREKLIDKGKASLSDAELIAILIGNGTRNKSAVDLARDVLNLANNNLNQLARLTIKDLCSIEGIGPAKSISIIASVELGNRKKQQRIDKKSIITSSADAYAYFGPQLEDKPYEEFWVLFLSRSNKIISSYKISEGGQEATVVDSKKLYKEALQQSASAVILCHNHPSGSTRPSQADIQLTGKLKDAGHHLDIAVVDHIIIGQGAYYSFADDGRL